MLSLSNERESKEHRPYHWVKGQNHYFFGVCYINKKQKSWDVLFKVEITDSWVVPLDF